MRSVGEWLRVGEALMKESRSCPGLADGSNIVADSGWGRWIPARREGCKERYLYHEREGLKADSLDRWKSGRRVTDAKEARRPIMRA